MAEFFTHRNIKATRKDHGCTGCTKLIDAGSPAWYFSTKCDGIFWDGHYHSDCRAAELALNELQDNRGDDFVGLPSIGDEPEDVDWLKDEYPEVAARMGFVKPREAA